jgi:hypothetical protein
MSDRGLPDNLAAGFAARQKRPFILIEAEFDSGTVRLWTGIGEKTIDGKVWTGVLPIMSIEPPGETSDTQATGGTIVLSGLDPAILSIALDEAYQGRRVTLYEGLLDADGAVIDSSIDILARGFLDVMDPSLDGATASIAVSMEDRRVVNELASNLLMTPAQLQIDYPEDRGFDFIAPLQDAVIQWGPS